MNNYYVTYRFPGYTFRCYDNTYNNNENETRIHWANTEKDNKCSYEKYIHYH